MKTKKITPPQLLVLSFFSIIIIGSLLLSSPWAAHGHTHYIDALFTATTAVCVTGLTTLDTGNHWTLFGQVVILLLVQIGGLGVMSFATFFALILGRKIHLRQRLVMQQAINLSSVGGVVRIFKHLLIFTFTLELTGALILAAHWVKLLGFKKGLWYGLFHSVSAFNNAGLDLFGNFRGLTNFTGDITVNLVITSLIILGGLGFYVLYEVFYYRKTGSLSLHSRLVLITTGLLILFGTLILFLSEYNHALKALPLSGKLLASYFQSVSPRTAGFNTIDLNSLFLSSQLVIIILMFIGGSPGSTAGGIKTSTFALIWVTIYSQLRGKRDIEIFERRIENNRILQALTLTLLFALTLIIITFLISLTYQGELVKIVFEVASALGTVGLTLGLTTHLTPIAKLLIITTMFLGRVGPLTLGFALAYRKSQVELRYPKGNVFIG